MPLELLPRPEPGEYAPFYAPYLARVPEAEGLAAICGQLGDVLPLLEAIPEAQAGHRYAPEKWSIRQVVGHLSDAERVFAYRLLRFSRADPTPLSGFDEDHFVAHGAFDARTLTDLTAEFSHLRQANVHLIQGLNPDMLMLTGSANGHSISVRALVFVMLGHVRHHVDVLQARYR